MRQARLPVVAGVALFAVIGCRGQSGPPPLNESELKDIHEMCQIYEKQHQKPPAQLSDLTTKEFEGPHPGAVAALKSGKYVVVYGVSVKDGSKVLAYSKEAATGTGPVVLANGTVQSMTTDQLNAAKGS